MGFSSYLLIFTSILSFDQFRTDFFFFQVSCGFCEHTHFCNLLDLLFDVLFCFYSSLEYFCPGLSTLLTFRFSAIFLQWGQNEFLRNAICNLDSEFPFLNYSPCCGNIARYPLSSLLFY